MKYKQLERIVIMVSLISCIFGISIIGHHQSVQSREQKKAECLNNFGKWIVSTNTNGAQSYFCIPR